MIGFVSHHLNNSHSDSDRQPLGRQFVEISAASRDEYYAAIAKVCTFFSDAGAVLVSYVFWFLNVVG